MKRVISHRLISVKLLDLHSAFGAPKQYVGQSWHSVQSRYSLIMVMVMNGPEGWRGVTSCVPMWVKAVPWVVHAHDVSLIRRLIPISIGRHDRVY